MSSTYDFIVVGAGPAGVALASRLANSKAKPSVLLLEAGGDNKDESLFSPAERYSLAFTQPSLDWGYQTVPQTQLIGQQIPYARGKGLGGSSAVNFCCWLIGSSEDFNEWANIVGDEAWNWENVKERFKKIEGLDPTVPDDYKKYISPQSKDHGTDGPLKMAFASVWEKRLDDVFIAAEELGLGVNPDITSGNPLGMGLGPSTLRFGNRSTASLYLDNTPSNLTVVTNASVAKILFNGSTATGVKTIDGREFLASRDVIVSAGSVNSPHLLLLSGLGPAAELEKHNIPLIKDLPQVGKNLTDHVMFTATLLQKPGTSDRAALLAEAETEAAKEQYAKYKTGPLTTVYGSIPTGWFKSDAIYASEEFAALPTHTQAHLKKPTMPLFELATHAPPLNTGTYALQPTDSYNCGIAFVMNPQSRGEIRLNTANAADAPVIDPRFLSHPYDRRVGIEALRQLMLLFEADVFRENTVKWIGSPESKGDEDIWAHIRKNVLTAWHMCSTVIMGQDEASACVDKDFRVFGVKNLRVADLSIAPLLPNNHTQSTAYLIGETAAEKIISEYGLDV